MHFTVSTYLTFARLFSPVILSLALYYVLPWGYAPLNIFFAVITGLLGFTDYLDGFLARVWKQETELGKVLDPIADKVFVAGVLIPLVALGKIYFYWAMLLIGREFFIAGLRESAVKKGFLISVSWWGKWKATLQYLYLFLVIGAPWPWTYFLMLERLVLLATLVLSGISAFKYVQSFLYLLNRQSCIEDQSNEI